MFYNALRHGLDYNVSGTRYDEGRHRQRVLANLKRRAEALGYILQEASPDIVGS